jgi:hypothetical protein
MPSFDDQEIATYELFEREYMVRECGRQAAQVAREREGQTTAQANVASTPPTPSLVDEEIAMYEFFERESMAHEAQRNA